MTKQDYEKLDQLTLITSTIVADSFISLPDVVAKVDFVHVSLETAIGEGVDA